MNGRKWIKTAGIMMIASTMILVGCGNEETSKKDTKEEGQKTETKQKKQTKKKAEEVIIESNEGRGQHEQLITVNMPPEAEYLNDDTVKVYEQVEEMYNNSVQSIVDDSITLLIGNYCYYDSEYDELGCSAVIINGTNTIIKNISFQATVKIGNQPEKAFTSETIHKFSKNDIGELKPNEGVSTALAFSDETPLNDGDEMVKVNPKDVTVQLKNIHYEIAEEE